MFETGVSELILVFVIGLLILGPERLPRVAAQIGRWVAKARRAANQLRYQLEREVALEELYKAQKKKPRPAASKEAAAAPGAQPSGSASDASSTGTGEGGAEAGTASGEAGAGSTSVDGAETIAPAGATASREASAGPDGEGWAADEDSAEAEPAVEAADGGKIRGSGTSR